jgi:hypothetical protein
MSIASPSFLKPLLIYSSGMKGLKIAKPPFAKNVTIQAQKNIPQTFYSAQFTLSLRVSLSFIYCPETSGFVSSFAS